MFSSDPDMVTSFCLRYKAVTGNEDVELVQQKLDFTEAMTIIDQSCLAAIMQTNQEHPRAHFKEEALVQQQRLPDAIDEGWNQNDQ